MPPLVGKQFADAAPVLGVAMIVFLTWYWPAPDTTTAPPLPDEFDAIVTFVSVAPLPAAPETYIAPPEDVAMFPLNVVLVRVRVDDEEEESEK